MGWLRPYAAKAIIRHEFDVDHLNIWVTFRFAIETTDDPLAEPVVHDVMPPLALWLVEVDDIEKAVTASAWQDAWTLLLTVPDIAVHPDRVTLEYEGPHEDLRITWEKQWEPWGPILSTDVIRVPVFVDRGDPAAYDYVAGDFVKDNAWHDLDLSSIVPTGAKAILLAVEVVQTAIGKTFWLRKNGNTNTKNVSRLKTQVGSVALTADVVTPCGGDRKLEYKADTGTWPVINVSVKGWWF